MHTLPSHMRLPPSHLHTGSRLAHLLHETVEVSAADIERVKGIAS